MTTLYLIRHSKPLKVNNNLNTDSLQIQNEKLSLSIEGEEIAKEKLSKDEYNNIDVLYSSSYVRAVQTAKYISSKNNIDINIVSDLGERRMGINSWDELPDDFEVKQLLDDNYKIGDGESQKEVFERMHSIIMTFINNNKNKRIAVVSHATALTFLLKRWCKVSIVNNKLRYVFNNKILLDDFFDYCETFKLEFDDNNNIIHINCIK